MPRRPQAPAPADGAASAGRPPRGARDRAEPSDSWRRIYAVVRRIPRGRVATYGQVAWVAGLPRQARLVGYALHAVGESTTVPWHRVVNAAGGVSARAEGPGGSVMQRLRLEQEGVGFDTRGRVPLDRYGWRPRGWPPERRPAD